MFNVTLQVKNDFQTVQVNAKTPKEAWGKAVELGISSVVVKIEESQAEKKARKPWNQKLNEMCANKEYMLDNRHEFVCRYVALMTATQYHRDRVDGYQLKCAGRKFQILWNGKKCGYSLMDAQTAYSWMVRLPLRKFQVEADQWRVQEC